MKKMLAIAAIGVGAGLVLAAVMRQLKPIVTMARDKYNAWRPEGSIDPLQQQFNDFMREDRDADTGMGADRGSDRRSGTGTPLGAQEQSDESTE